MSHGPGDRDRDIDAAEAAARGCPAEGIAEVHGYGSARQARRGVRRGLAQLVALEAEPLRREVHRQAEAAWAEVEARLDAEPGSPEFRQLMTATDEAVTAMEREATLLHWRRSAVATSRRPRSRGSSPRRDR